MSRSEKVVQKCFDIRHSSGDSNEIKSKQSYQEENNNEIDELSKDLSEMGCIVDAVKRPPNICVENCVYEGSEEENRDQEDEVNEEDAYTDDFDEDNSEVEEVPKIEAVTRKDSAAKLDASSMKLSKSQSFTSNHSKTHMSTVSSRPSYGSISVPQTRRTNMSFTNDRLREIERHNQILLNKILSARNTRKSSIPPRDELPMRKPVPSAAVHRKKQQRQIDHDNMILLRKIQRAKSSACSFRR